MSSTEPQTQSRSDMINKIVDNIITSCARVDDENSGIALSNSIPENTSSSATTTATTTTVSPTSSLSDEMDDTIMRSKKKMRDIPSTTTPSNRKLDNNTSKTNPVMPVVVLPFVPMVS